MAANRFVMILLVAAATAALVAARPQQEKQGDISNEIPLDTEINTSPAPAGVSPVGGNASADNTTAAPAFTTAAPPRSTMFSRIINDIFQIPITVLRAVNTLLNNSFGRSARSS